MLSRMNTVAARVNERRAKKKQFNNMPVKIKGKTVVAGLSVLILGLASCNTTNDRADVISGASPAEVERPVTLEEIAPPELKARILVVYFSQGEAARRVAEDLALLLDADIERIIEKKNRKGFFGFMGAGADSSFKRATRIEDPVLHPAEYDYVYVCTPVWAWSLAPPVRSWLKRAAGELPGAVYVTVSGDTEPEKIVRMMEMASGTVPLGYEGFAERDFAAANRQEYLEKLRSLVAFIPSS